MSRKLASLASVLGHGFAYMQHGIDRAVEWTLKGVKQATREDPAETPKKEKQRHTYINAARKVGRRSIFFLGDLGDAFYTKYEELKRKT